MDNEQSDQSGFSAFVSYATDDDRGHNSFISCFADELNLALPARVRNRKLQNIALPRVHLSGDMPLLAGRLGNQLKANIAASFAMFIFVHEQYINSPWCLKELEYFKELFQDDGFLDRLYVIAMSERQIGELTCSEDWKRLCPFEDQIWVPFYRDDRPDRPLDIYSRNSRNSRTVIDSEFWGRFDAILTDLAAKIRNHVLAAPKDLPYPVNRYEAPATLEAEPNLVRVYIESDTQQDTRHESLGAEVAKSWERLVVRREVTPRLYLRPSGLAMTEIDQRPRLDDADGVMLLWNDKTPASVAAQIKKLEPKLVGPRPAPGLIAYVVQQGDDLPGVAPIYNWKVVRFRADASGSIVVVQQDEAMLTEFLELVLARKGSIPGPVATPDAALSL